MTRVITSDHLLDYIRGNLSPDMREKVEQSCEQDKALAEELAYYEGLSKAISGDRAEKDELQWQRLSRAIDNISEPIAPKVPANDTGRVWRWAACALAVALIGQTALTSLNSGKSDDDRATYVTVTQETTANSLQVGFVPLATELDIRTLLLEVEAEIVRGPTALGLYKLRFESEVTQESALLKLTENSDIVETVAKN